MASPNELSFLPDDYLERKAQRRTNVICALLFLVVMIAIGTAFTFTERLGREVEQEHANWENKYTDAARRIQLKQQLEQKQATMEKQAELSASLLEKVPRSYLLARVTNSLPPGVSLLDLIMESKLKSNTSAAGNAPTARTAFEQKRAAAADPKKKAADAAAMQQAKVYDVTVKLVGVAFTDVQVAQFITKLNQVKLFKEVNLLISDEFREKEGDQQLRRFQIEALLDPAAEAPADAIDKPKTAAVEIKENQQ